MPGRRRTSGPARSASEPARLRSPPRCDGPGRVHCNRHRPAARLSRTAADPSPPHRSRRPPAHRRCSPRFRSRRRFVHQQPRPAVGRPPLAQVDVHVVRPDLVAAGGSGLLTRHCFGGSDVDPRIREPPSYCRQPDGDQPQPNSGQCGHGPPQQDVAVSSQISAPPARRPCPIPAARPRVVPLGLLTRCACAPARSGYAARTAACRFLPKAATGPVR